jgi:hypothetical protein
LLLGAGEDVAFGNVFVTSLFGLFMSLFLPSVVGMDVGRMHELSRLRENKIGVVSTVLLDRLVGLISLVITAMIALIIAGYQYVGAEVIYVVVGSAVLMAIAWLLFFNRKVMRHFRWVLELPVIQHFYETFEDLYTALHELQHQRRLLGATLLTSMVMVILEVSSVVLVARAIDVTINPVYFFIFMPLIWVIIAIPISIGGLGVREAVFVSFFTQVGMTAAQAILISLLYYSFTLIAGAVGGLIWMRASAVSLLSDTEANEASA